MIIFSDSRDPIFYSRDRIGSLKHLKQTLIYDINFGMLQEHKN